MDKTSDYFLEQWFSLGNVHMSVSKMRSLCAHVVLPWMYPCHQEMAVTCNRNIVEVFRPDLNESYARYIQRFIHSRSARGNYNKTLIQAHKIFVSE